MSAGPAASPPAGAPPRHLRARRALLVVVAVGMLTGVLAGLGRLGVGVAWGPRYALDHGPLLVMGAFGTVIALERAVALGQAWALAAPALGAAGAIAMLAGAPWAASLAVASTLALVVLNAAIVRRQAATFTWLMLLGSTLLTVGAVAWAGGRPVARAVPAWLGFFVLTIVAERLELSRLAPTPRWARRLLAALAVALAASTAAATLGAAHALRVAGVALAALAAWQLRFDLARHTVRRPGLPRFAASGVLAGAVWLLATGLLLAAREVPPAGPLHDAAVHGVLVGYVLSMVFAHAPIILPAVGRVTVRFTPLLYAPLAALHGGLALRVLGDLVGEPAWRRDGAIASALALALFALTVVGARVAASGRRRAGRG